MSASSFVRRATSRAARRRLAMLWILAAAAIFRPGAADAQSCALDGMSVQSVSLRQAPLYTVNVVLGQITGDPQMRWYAEDAASRRDYSVQVELSGIVTVALDVVPLGSSVVAVSPTVREAAGPWARDVQFAAGAAGSSVVRFAVVPDGSAVNGPCRLDASILFTRFPTVRASTVDVACGADMCGRVGETMEVRILGADASWFRETDAASVGGAVATVRRSEGEPAYLVLSPSAVVSPAAAVTVALPIDGTRYPRYRASGGSLVPAPALDPFQATLSIEQPPQPRLAFRRGMRTLEEIRADEANLEVEFDLPTGAHQPQPNASYRIVELRSSVGTTVPVHVGTLDVESVARGGAKGRLHAFATTAPRSPGGGLPVLEIRANDQPRWRAQFAVRPVAEPARLAFRRPQTQETETRVLHPLERVTVTVGGRGVESLSKVRLDGTEVPMLERRAEPGRLVFAIDTPRELEQNFVLRLEESDGAGVSVPMVGLANQRPAPLSFVSARWCTQGARCVERFTGQALSASRAEPVKNQGSLESSHRV